VNDTNLDFERHERLGFPEIVYGERKSSDQVEHIARLHGERGLNLLITRVEAEQVSALAGSGEYDPVARTFMRIVQPPPSCNGVVGVVSAGTSDAPVVRETVNTLRFLGCESPSFEDAGVAGIHRLLRHREQLLSCRVLVCVAGFEGALASVVAGLFPQPIIAVPTSVGYGVAADGQAALNAMLASCANGLTVMNIDNGCGAALAAYRIVRPENQP
jgi:NCAIR mutase (PurE)-related protein